MRHNPFLVAAVAASCMTALLRGLPACGGTQRAAEVSCGKAEEAKVLAILAGSGSAGAKATALTLEVGPEYVACVLRTAPSSFVDASIPGDVASEK